MYNQDYRIIFSIIESSCDTFSDSNLTFYRYNDDELEKKIEEYYIYIYINSLDYCL
jgi:hypothetical protein